MSTRLTIRGLVESATGRTDKTTLINDAIDIAVEEVSTQHLWSDLLVEDSVTTVAGTQSIALATNLARVFEIRVIDSTLSYRLVIRPKSWITRQFPNPTSRTNAKPVYGYLEGTTLFTIPVSDIAYTITYSYHRTHPALAADSDVVLIRAASSAVTAYAIYWVFQSIEKHEDAKHWLETYMTQLHSARKVDRENSVVEHVFDQRGFAHVNPNDPWLDPFVRSTPGYPWGY